ECGAGAPAEAHFCPQCTKILPLNRPADYFAFLGLSRKLQIDPAELERRFRDLSRQFHPDYFYNASAPERRASLERSSYLNDAYRTLKPAIGRVEYLLQLEGLAAANPREASAQVPPALLQEVFALNEELDEIRDLRAGGTAPAELKARLERARMPIEEKRTEHEAQLDALSARWDALSDHAPAADRRAVLAALHDRVMERSYIRNLLASIERELSQ
ncbi:MAG TPA: Fe-S protein assembly co-chaperone HscB, partial [Vicinamibacterales bacterium]|nr:Fe-S protein assembly co-chaperone HscB [Vicinamibacterales bacterium]